MRIRFVDGLISVALGIFHDVVDDVSHTLASCVGSSLPLGAPVVS